ncbi:hypothetical protein CCR94_17200 [Rhodoblastus sphagnicola]|uniref:Uncharacterized protein n=1 Tax=Rhodoblastus sphagnicola TaxID=333368 RepID=A0A2S6N225_9HYPH|nr:exonuclease domain-containing protein [Rhodoblastus sphagnicola]MBB4199719.1 exodeoxyribonuclease-1 [Rhodoblastus sphagnicola]PPQ28659.1 hypothetical protein CCR94_17200 [Rhodoblastus sphagnicola]
MTKERNYVLFDLETTGTVRGYDQILQCAATLTDSNFQVLDQINLRCPRFEQADPFSLSVRHKQDNPSDARLTHYEMIHRIDRTFRDWSSATFCAHNLVAFDDFHLRQALVQTLHNPDLTQTNGNRRADTMLIARALSVLAPSVLKVPVCNGMASFRLGPLVRINGIRFEATRLHDASADVEILRQLMIVMMTRAQVITEMLIAGSQRGAVDALVQNHPYFRYTSVHSGRPFSRILAPITTAPSDPNLLVVADLAFDVDLLRRMDDVSLADAFKSSPRKLRVIPLDKAPILTAVGAFVTEPRVGVSAATLASRAKAIREDRDFQSRVSHFMRRAANDGAARDRKLHIPSISQRNEEIAASFHDLPWGARRGILESLDDPELKAFGLRLLYAEAPECLSPAEREEIFRWQCGRIEKDQDVPWLAESATVSTIASMIAREDADENRRLRAGVEYLAALRSVATQYPHGRLA